MKPIKINIDAVPEDKRTHPSYLGLLTDMTRGMADQAKVISVCTHEAGHFFFGAEMKMEILGIEGPRIIYIESNQFRGHAAHVNIKIVSNKIEEVAIMLSAGGVCSTEFNKTLGSGDSEDFELFKTACQNMGLSDETKIHSLWKDGQKYVRDRLKDLKLRDAIPELARRLMSMLENPEGQ